VTFRNLRMIFLAKCEERRVPLDVLGIKFEERGRWLTNPAAEAFK
jgi:hypothetical protein